MDPIVAIDLNDTTWAKALTIVRSSLHLPSSLPHLMRGCWSGSISKNQLLKKLAAPGYSPTCVLRAAKVRQADEFVHVNELRAAIDNLGVKAASVITAINLICERTLDSGPANKLWQSLFKEMMAEIEIGHHLGSNLARVGFERGMLVGFARLGGLAILLIHEPEKFGLWYTNNHGSGTSQEALATFGCEPYQVSALLMQQLGLGAEVAVATAVTLGDIPPSVIEPTPTMQMWKAAHHWVQALKSGQPAPKDEHYRQLFPELLVDPKGESIPAHIRALLEQVEKVRREQSLWTWHLPLPTYEETADAIIYRVQTNASGTTWTKGLVLEESRS